MIRAEVIEPFAWRAADVTLGLSVLGWAVLGLVHAPPGEAPSAVRLTVVVINAVVGVLILRRGAEQRAATVGQLAAAVPAFVLGGLALKLAPAPATWHPLAQALFVVGGVLVLAALIHLGRSFAILPGLRTVVARGPYRLVRHPAYLGELALLVACAGALASPWSLVLVALAPPLVAARIVAEERVLAASEEYRVYTRRVRFRLIPGLW